MTIIRRAEATWQGSVAKGSGNLAVGSGAVDVPYSLTARTTDTDETNPEELVGAALAGCFTMSLANLLTRDGHPPTRLTTAAAVQLVEGEAGFAIPRIELEVRGDAPDVDEERFLALVDEAADCPISRLYSSAEITVSASLGSE